jgi:hypothetical protein
MAEERVIGIIGMKIMPNFSKLGKRVQLPPAIHALILLKVHKIEIFFGFDFEICIISLLVMSKY